MGARGDGRRGGRLRPGRVGLAVTVLVGLVLGGVPRQLGAQQVQTRGAEVLELRFPGARAFDPDLLSSAIVTAATRCRLPGPLAVVCWLGRGVDRQYLDENVLRADAVRLRLFYFQRGYRQAQVQPEVIPKAEGVRVDFRIDEGQPVRVASVELVGPTELLPSDIQRRLALQPGRPFSLLDYEAARDTLVGRLKDRGYARAEVLASYTIPADSPLVARVRYELIPGIRARFGVPEVIGAEKVSPNVVLRMLTFDPGDVYREQELIRSQRNLFGLDIFKHVEIRARPEAMEDSIIPVTVQVNEGNVHRVRLGVGINTIDAVNAEARWTSRNFRGGARRLEVRGQLSNVLASQLREVPAFETGGGVYGKLNGSLAVDFAQPWFFSPLNTFGAGLFFERRSIPDVFVRTAAGGFFSLLRAVSARTSVNLAYRPELTYLETEGDVFFCANLNACGPEEIRVLKEAHWLAPVTISAVRDHSNSLFSPTSGYILRLEAEHASRVTGSAFAYTRLTGELSEYREIVSGVVVAARVRGGWARAAEGAGTDGAFGLHPQKRFFAGGPNSVRGFAQYRLGPKVLTINAARDLAAPVHDPRRPGAGCTAASINDGSCDATALAERHPDRFDVRPVGGGRLLEGNFELRFPLLGDKVRGAAFVDFGQVWSEDSPVRLGELAWAPGFGVRYMSVIGPIRVDVGYNPGAAERLPVITTGVEPCSVAAGDPTCYATGEGGLTGLRNTNELRPLSIPVALGRRSFFDRLQLHLSIGQAF